VGVKTDPDMRSMSACLLFFRRGFSYMPYTNIRFTLSALCAALLLALSLQATAADPPASTDAATTGVDATTVAPLATPDATAASAPSSSAATTTATTPAATAATSTAPATSAASDQTGNLATVVVTAHRLDLERSEIETLTGATTTTINAAAIAAMPGGSNVQLNTVLLQAPDVAQDSFGQIHVRGDHNDLQYRLNGIILPEGISVFSQTLDPRIIESMDLITGALPAEYGLRTAGIIDLTTKGGLLQPGGTVSLYGGSHSTLEPSGWYGGSDGGFSYFVSADVLRNDLGIESPDASPEPLHDHSTQTHGFGYFEDILNDNNRVSLVLGLSNEQFQIPDKHGLQPTGVGGVTGLGPCGNGVSFYTPPCQGTDMQVLQVNGQYTYLSNNLNENQHELAQYAILTEQYSQERFHLESSVSARYTSLDFEPDWIGDLLYNGIAQNAFKSDAALAWQTDAIYHLTTTHDVRFGFYLQHDNSTSATTSTALPIDAFGFQTSDIPAVIVDNGSQTQSIESVYLQDEWKPLDVFTLNYGLRFDSYRAYSSGSQLSPRINFVWNALAGMSVHGGFSRYFTPPPFELIASETFTKFANTTAVPPGTNTEDTPPIAERADYYDFGVQQKLLDNALTLGVDTFFRTAQNLIDEGQFGAPIILTPFNYRFGKVGGEEFSSNYQRGNFSTYANLSFQTARGKDVESSQFNFTDQQLEYIAGHYIHLDHEERVSASGGVAYAWLGTRADLDMIFGTGLRQNTPWLVAVPGFPGGLSIPNGDHTPSYMEWNLGLSHAFHDAAGPLTLRFDLVNVFDKVYLIRSGTGIGVFEPQYGAPRGFFGGIAQDF
jgi:outer membrane receptor for ferrienterochelin and colicins